MVSVIVPVYKVEPYLNRCVESIVNQTYRDLEIILVDDGSPDACPAMCDAWAARDERIRVIHKENGGLSDARNAGLDIAQGEYISFIDSDDWIARDMLAHLLSIMRKTGAEIAECGVMEITDGKTPPVELECNRQKVRVFETTEALYHLLIEDIFRPTVWNKLYCRACIAGLRFEKGKIHEDVFFTHQTFGRCRKVAKADRVGYYYLQRTESIMGKEFSLKNLDGLDGKVARAAYMEKYFPELIFVAKKGAFFFGTYCGQRLLQAGTPGEIQQGIAHIRRIQQQVELTGKEIEQLTKKEKLWYIFARYHLRWCCTLRNILGIGM